MTHVATLVARPGGLDEAGLDRAEAALRGPVERVVLSAGEAVDLLFTPEGVQDDRLFVERLRAAVAGPVDIVVQPQAGRRKKLFLADMDSTMIEQECIDELADFAGFKPHVAAITERAMRGEIAFEPALRERVALLAGLPAEVIDQVLAERITLTPGARTLVATLRQAGVYTALVSGGFTHFTAAVAERLGFHEHRANGLLLEGARLSGQVAEPILGRDAKRARLIALREAQGLFPHETLAVGDGANDLAMLEAAGLGVAFHAKPAVAAAAHARIDHGDLTVLLFAQGYRRTEFVAAERPAALGD